MMSETNSLPQPPDDKEPETAQEMVQALMASGMTPMEIAKNIGISWRTIYRWERAEHQPQRESDLTALRELVKKNVH